MATTEAREKFACPACGADAHWNPGKQALICPYCGTTSPLEKNSEGGIVEHDLVTALRNVPMQERGWKAEKKSVKCQHCQAISVFDPVRVAQRCEFCGSAQIVPYEQLKPPISPESLLPFKVTEPQVREEIRRWYGSRWFAPNRMKNAALTDQVRGIYLPYWTFDARCVSHWRAESGYHYYTTETYRDANGNTQTRRVQHTRWQPSSGTVQHVFDDELVSASKGVNLKLLNSVEPFPTKELAPYAAHYVAGWTVEQYQVDLAAASHSARQNMENEMERLCASQVPGDTHRNLQVNTHFSSQTFKHVLLPVYLLTYNYGAKTYHVLVNGYTGDIAGERPYSAVKIFFLVVAILIAAGIALLISNS
ncbi:MAG: zinc ribbon domain-containing protein [Verrucomicrobiales bacterium]